MTDNRSNEVLLKVENLRQYFGRKNFKAVDGVSFEIRKGEVFGLVGESGCGKTTTGRSIIKLYNCTGGNVWFKGQRICAGVRDYKENIARKKAEAKELIRDMKKRHADSSEIVRVKQETREYVKKQKSLMAEAKDDQRHCDAKYRALHDREIREAYAEKLRNEPGRTDELRTEMDEELKKNRERSLVTGIQMIYQDPVASLNPRMTCNEIISEGLTIRGEKDREKLNRMVGDMLETVGLVREHADRYPHEFSGGQRQRIGIARAVIMEPELIIADEPVSALDVSIQAQVINLLNDLRKKMGLTVLFIAHDLSVVKYISDRIGVMYYGKLVEMASSEELFRHPMHPYTQSLLSAIPLPDPNYEKRRRRIRYVPRADYDMEHDAPVLREVAPGHFVSCDTAEFDRYREELSRE